MIESFEISNNSIDGGDKDLYDNHGGASTTSYEE